VKGNDKALLSFMWQMVSHFGHKTDSGNNETSDPIANMLRWINQHTEKKNITVENFTSSFQNGSAFAALMHSVTSLSIGNPAFPWDIIASADSGLAGKFFGF
jgi:hypothetical protein